MRKTYLIETLEERLKNLYNEIKHTEMNEGERCECGGRMNEGECMECGKMYEMIDEEDESKNPEDKWKKWCESGDERCNQFTEKDFEGEEIDEGNMFTRKLAKTRKGDKFTMNGKTYTDTSDLDEEMEEGNKFTEMLGKTPKGGKFKLGGKTYTDNTSYDIKENIEYHIQDNTGDVIKLNENELVDLIEDIVLEQESKGFKISKPKGLATYEKAHKDSGRENTDYLKSVSKKMNDYLKTGSKGKYDTNPKIFPKGNGELAKMDKKAFKITDELEDFNYEIAGQQFPSPDEIDYNEDWMNKLFDGDSMTGNAPGGNALESEANKRFNKLRKKNTLKKLKDQSYKRAPQPVFKEKSGNDEGKLNVKLESMNEKEKNKINEEFNRMMQLFSYNRKTQ